MDVLRELIWLWVIIGMISVSLGISLIFVLINKCFSDKAAQSRTSEPATEPEFYTQNNKYHPDDIEDDLPPLPPRGQFLKADVQSYENLAELPDYVKVEDEVVLPPRPTPPPPYQKQETEESCSQDSVSIEEYDDIGAEDDYEGEEDYDDVG